MLKEINLYLRIILFLLVLLLLALGGIDAVVTEWLDQAYMGQDVK